VPLSRCGVPPMLWVRSEVFDHGAVNTSVRWTAPRVLEFLGSLRAIISSTTIGRATWIEATTTRCEPALSEGEAAAYWHVFLVLRWALPGPHQNAGDSLDIRFIGSVLMCQVFTPHRIRTDHKAMSSEAWPSQERASISSPRHHSPRGTPPRVVVSSQSSIGRGRDASAAIVAFVRQHLVNFLQVACLSFTAEPASVTAEEFDTMALVLCGGQSLMAPAPRISEANPDLLSKRTLPAKDLQRWAESVLVWNDELYPSVEQPTTPALVEPWGATISIAGMSKATWFQRPSSTAIEYINITSCTDCVIYIISNSRFCLIDGCHDCTIIMPGVSAVCSVKHCEKISIHVAAHCFKIENSIDSSAHIYCHVPPILSGDTRGIKLAPFNVLYSKMDALLASIDMTLDPRHVDTWAHPVCCTLGSPDETLGGRAGSFDDSHTSTYQFVHPKNFQPVIIPESNRRGSFANPKDVPSNLCLPQVYEDAMQTRAEEMRGFHRMLSEIKDEDKRRRAQQAIQGHFREWMQSTGKSRHLADLARIAQGAMERL